MKSTTYFDQECPTCGRCLQVRVAYLGRRVACQHCGGKFDACHPESSTCAAPESSSEILRRAGELLSSIDDLKSRPR